jgi:hypothetical protein
MFSEAIPHTARILHFAARLNPLWLVCDTPGRISSFEPLNVTKAFDLPAHEPAHDQWWNHASSPTLLPVEG